MAAPCSRIFSRHLINSVFISRDARIHGREHLHWEAKGRHPSTSKNLWDPSDGGNVHLWDGFEVPRVSPVASLETRRPGTRRLQRAGRQTHTQ